MEHTRYTHAAVYVGYDGLFCEALPQGGVQFSSLDEKIADTCILALRAKGLTTADRQRVARGAADYRNTRYGWEQFLKALLPSLIRRLRERVDSDTASALIGSTLCSRALLRAGVAVLPPDGGLVTPAWLSSAPQFEDVSLEWRRVAPIAEPVRTAAVSVAAAARMPESPE